jgi:hypothetical protein
MVILPLQYRERTPRFRSGHRFRDHEVIASVHSRLSLSTRNIKINQLMGVWYYCNNNCVFRRFYDPPEQRGHVAYRYYS